MKKNLLLLFMAMFFHNVSAQWENTYYAQDVNPYVNDGVFDSFIVSTVRDSSYFNGSYFYWANSYSLPKSKLRISVSNIDGLANWVKESEKPVYTKIDVGLPNVDDTSDANKPISTAQATALNGKVDKVSGKQLSDENYTSIEKSKLSGIASGATLNSTDAYLLSRVNHTGTQPASTITGLSAVATNGSYNLLNDKLTAGVGISIIGGVVSNTYTPYIAPTSTVVTRSLNSNFTPSTTKQAFVSYSVTCTVTNPLLAGTSTANVFLEYSTNAGGSWTTFAQNGNSSGVGLAVAVAITNTQTVTLCGYVPANALVRLRTSTTGTANVTYVTGQETY